MADTQPEAKSALDGVRVIEACEGAGGPLAAMLLAEQGADVIKVELPAGDRLRGSAASHVYNRSKRAVALDLEREEERDRLRGLIGDADVFLHDWRPGEAERLGLDTRRLRAAYPQLIVGHLPPYGSRGPWAQLPPDEALMQALSGVCDAQYRYDPRPVMLTLPVAGTAQALMAAISVTAALLARARDGGGERFEVSGVSAMLAFEASSFLRGEHILRMAGQADPKSPIPTYRLVRGSDGKWLFAGALTPAFWASMAIAIGLDECLVDPRFAGAPMGIANVDDRRELARRVDEAFTKKPRDEWLRILEEADVPRAPLNTRDEWARDPHVVHNTMLVEIEDPELGRTRQMGVPVRLRRSPGRVRGPAPRLGEHNALLHEATPEPPDIAPPRPESERLPSLAGITVIDLSGFIAGASASMMLADLGARVIKVEPPDGDGWRSSGLAFLGSNRGKRSLCIDLRKPEGRELLLELIDGADVLHDNFRSGVIERLGLGWDVVSKRNPRLVQSSVTGYGTEGPLAHLPGFDPMMQARGGIMLAQGEPGGEPVYLQPPVCDFGTALTCAFGIITALVARERTGLGDRVETSLAWSALTVQAGESIFYDGRTPDTPGGRDLAGRHALYRIYATSDRAIMLACTTPDQAACAARIAGVTLPDGDVLAQPLYGETAQAFERAFAPADWRTWVDRFSPHGVPCAPCVPVNDIFEEPDMVDNGCWWDTDDPRWGAIRQHGEIVRFDVHPMHLQRRAPLLGEHSTEVLLELGIERDRVEELLASGVVAQRKA